MRGDWEKQYEDQVTFVNKVSELSDKYDLWYITFAWKMRKDNYNKENIFYAKYLHKK